MQFAHYLGYFLMSLPAGWLATKLGYKGGIIAGLLIVAAGGFWFIPATHINDLVRQGRVSPTTAFVGFLAGVCVIATGLTFLETIANPYTTVLGDPRNMPPRASIWPNPATASAGSAGPSSAACISIRRTPPGHSTGSQTLYIPYVGIAVVVIVLAVIFYFADVPDIKTRDDYHLDDAAPGAAHSIWSHPHFVLAVVAQFFYVAAQAGIFSFFINYMTSERAAHSRLLGDGVGKDLAPTRLSCTAGCSGWFETNAAGAPGSQQQGRVEPRIARAWSASWSAASAAQAC